MSLTPIELELASDPVQLTEPEQACIAAAQRAVARVQRRQPDVRRLVQISDAMAFCAGLRALQQKGQHNQGLRGRRFCEWGSGIGLMTALASLHGLDAYGIEADTSLLEAAQRTFPAGSHGPRFAHGSFVPAETAGSFRVVGTYGATIWQPSTDHDPYAALGLACTEVDLVYAYPWPRELGLYEALFDCSAGPGALLWLFSPGAPPRFMRKVPDS